MPRASVPPPDLPASDEATVPTLPTIPNGKAHDAATPAPELPESSTAPVAAPSPSPAPDSHDDADEEEDEDEDDEVRSCSPILRFSPLIAPDPPCRLIATPIARAAPSWSSNP